MNKKLMALAVAGAFAAPTAVMAQSSNVQVFGTIYMEYATAHQGATAAGDLTNIDVMQAPGSEIGFKGEEALGGGMSAWFQCTSTADIRGAGEMNQKGVTTPTAPAIGVQNSGVFCGRNSAIGLKTSVGNVYGGNWDSPMKATIGAARIISDTGIYGAGPLLFGASSSYIDNQTPTSFSRRQNSSMFYDTPVMSGFQGKAMISTPSYTANGNQTLNTTVGNKPRAWGVAGTYTNGPIYLTASYESHSNFSANTVLVQYAGTDSGATVGGTYQLGPVKVGVIYTRQNFDLGVSANNVNAAAANIDGKVSAWNFAGEWAIQGPHALRGGYTKVNSTSGNGGTNALNITLGNRTFNGGLGSTGANMWQTQYVYSASKRTELTAGYVKISNDANATYSLGGLTTPKGGQNQDAFAISIKNTF